MSESALKGLPFLLGLRERRVTSGKVDADGQTLTLLACLGTESATGSNDTNRSMLVIGYSYCAAIVKVS